MSFNLSNNLKVSAATMASHVILENIFSNEELEKIITHFDTLGLDKSEISQHGNGILDGSIRTSLVKLHSVSPANEWIFARLNQAAQQANDHFFRFNLTGYDELQYTVYKGNGAHYDFHTDMPYWANLDTYLTRKLSFSLILSDPDQYDGGEFEFITDHPNKPVKAEQKKGDLILFPGWMIHRITPVLKGERKSLVGWIMGPKFT
jgi:PKHD-type hydroxylase